ncbi:MAG: SRPBCC family protein [Acidobacteriaceae bacterium]
MSDPYRFTHTWRIRASLDRVFPVLYDIARYPLWWPQVTSVVRLDEDSGEVTIRSILPVSLRFTLKQVVADEKHGVLEADLSGDLEGWSRWTLQAVPNGTLARFDEVARLHHPIPSAIEPLLRPLWNANHAAMMRQGERGLQALLRQSPSTAR